MNKNQARVILNKLRERLMEHMDYDSLDAKEQYIFDEIDEFIMNFEDEL